jgi:hypothetical protein
MPTRLRHYQQAGDLHFLTFSCYHRFAYFDTAAACDLFESALERVRARYAFVVKGPGPQTMVGGRKWIGGDPGHTPTGVEPKPLHQ